MENMPKNDCSVKSEKIVGIQKASYKAGSVSIVLNILLFGAKFWVGLLTGSLALMADAWHTLSDSFTSIIVIVAAKIAGKPADKEHPFGHGRIGLLGSIVIGLILAVVAFNFFIESLGRFADKQSVVYGLPAIIVTIISILSKEGLAQYSFSMGKKWEAKALVADGWHHRSDALSSVIVLVGIFLGPYFWWIDSVLGLIVAILLGHATYSILKSSVNSFLGETPDEHLIEEIYEIAKELSIDPQTLHHLHIHHYGHHRELTFHMYLESTLNLEEAHNIATELETHLRNKLAIEATIHMEPLG